MKKTKNLVIICLAAAVVLFILNDWISRKIEGFKLFKNGEPVVASKFLNQKQDHYKKHFSTKVTRNTLMDPSRKYSINMFYADGKEVARFKNTGDKIYDLTGNIPDGNVSFTDNARKTYGTEDYYENQRHGLFKEYYEDGNIRRDAKYAKGKIKWSKEYYIDGTLRMEENYQDVLIFSESKEVGVGKVYYRDGKLMYEWNITTRNQGGYNRSYNRDGILVAENVFDENGKLIKKRTLKPKSANASNG